jgi:hypothetical protein
MPQQTSGPMMRGAAVPKYCHRRADKIRARFNAQQSGRRLNRASLRKVLRFAPPPFPLHFPPPYLRQQAAQGLEVACQLGGIGRHRVPDKVVGWL